MPIACYLEKINPAGRATHSTHLHSLIQISHSDEQFQQGYFQNFDWREIQLCQGFRTHELLHRLT
jgi:hypothetical protein